MENMSKGNLKITNHIRTVVDGLLFVSVAIAFVYMEEAGHSVDRGFMCNDESIRYPRLPDTIPTSMLLAIGLPLPCLIVLVVEFASRQPRAWGRKKMILSILKFYGLIFYGSGITVLVTNILKLSTGRLRPHFIATCNPNWAFINCSIPWQYVEHVECSKLADPKEVQDARTSFPSGHSSFAMHQAVFTVLYFQLQLKTPSFSRLLKSLLQVSALVVGVFTCVSRVVDYRHHVGDALAGGLLGTGLALWMFYVILPHHQSKRLSVTSTQEGNNAFSPEQSTPNAINGSSPLLNGGKHQPSPETSVNIQQD